MGSAHSKSHVFPIKILSKTNAFSDASFRTSFFEVLMRLDAKTLDFGSPLAPSWGQNDVHNRPSGAKNEVLAGSGGRCCDRLASRITFGAFLGTTFVDLG